MDEIERLTTSLAHLGFYVHLRRQTTGWACSLFNSVMKGVPTGEGMTTLEALKAADADRQQMKSLGR